MQKYEPDRQKSADVERLFSHSTWVLDYVDEVVTLGLEVNTLLL